MARTCVIGFLARSLAESWCVAKESASDTRTGLEDSKKLNWDTETWNVIT